MKIPDICEDLAEEVGLHLGDGSMNFYSEKGLYQLRGHMIDDHDHYFGRISYLYKTLFDIDVNIKNYPKTGVLGFQIWNDELVNFKAGLGLPLGKKEQFRIPQFVDSKELFFAMMRGYFDTDGSLCFYKKGKKYLPRIDIKSTSYDFLHECHTRLIDFGIKNSFYGCKRKNKNWNTIYSIVLRGRNVRTWFEFIGSNNPKQKRKMTWWSSSNFK